MPAVRNYMQKEAEKNKKNKSLCIDIQRMWNRKYMIIPVMTGATGIITKSLMKNLENITAKYLIVSLQQTATL